MENCTVAIIKEILDDCDGDIEYEYTIYVVHETTKKFFSFEFDTESLPRKKVNVKNNCWTIDFYTESENKFCIEKYLDQENGQYYVSFISEMGMLSQTTTFKYNETFDNILLILEK